MLDLPNRDLNWSVLVFYLGWNTSWFDLWTSPFRISMGYYLKRKLHFLISLKPLIASTITHISCHAALRFKIQKTSQDYPSLSSPLVPYFIKYLRFSHIAIFNTWATIQKQFPNIKAQILLLLFYSLGLKTTHQEAVNFLLQTLLICRACQKFT